MCGLFSLPDKFIQLLLSGFKDPPLKPDLQASRATHRQFTLRLKPDGNGIRLTADSPTGMSALPIRCSEEPLILWYDSEIYSFNGFITYPVSYRYGNLMFASR